MRRLVSYAGDPTSDFLSLVPFSFHFTREMSFKDQFLMQFRCDGWFFNVNIWPTNIVSLKSYWSDGWLHMQKVLQRIFWIWRHFVVRIGLILWRLISRVGGTMINIKSALNHTPCYFCVAWSAFFLSLFLFIDPFNHVLCCIDRTHRYDGSVSLRIIPFKTNIFVELLSYLLNIYLFL